MFCDNRKLAQEWTYGYLAAAQPPGMPRIEFKPGLAQEMLRELGPMLAEEGIDVPDLETLQAAMNRAVERRNMELFSPVGEARDYAVNYVASGRRSRL